MWSQIIKLMLLITVTRLFAHGNDDFTEDDDEYRIINVTSGRNVTLTCHNGTNLPSNFSWTADSLNETQQRGDYQIQRRQLYEQLLKSQRNEIFLKNVTYAYTGSIRCTSSNGDIRYYYLIVKDEDILSLGTTRTFSTDVLTYYGRFTTVPCRVTAPDVHVDLFLGNPLDPKLQRKVASKDDSNCYSLRRGFIFDHDTCKIGLPQGSTMAMYTCKFSRNSTEESLTSRIIIRRIDYFPKDDNEYRIINVKSGRNVILTCLNGNNLFFNFSWTADSLEEEQQRDDYQIQRRQLNEQLKSQIRNKIFLNNVTYAYTGSIICASSNGPIRYYYLIVKDEDILSLGTTRTFSTDVLTVHGFFTIVPCLVTALDVHVDLFFGNSLDPKLQRKVASKDDSNCYNLRRGFIFDHDTCKLALSPGLMIYTCKFSRNSTKESLTSRIITPPTIFTVTQPSLSKVDVTNKDVVGGRLLLRCSIHTNKAVSIKWLTPQTDNEEDHIEIFTPQQNNFTDEIVSWLTINNMTASDEGRYYCMARHKEDEFNLNYRFILFYQAQDVLFLNQTYVHLRSNTETGISVTWHVSFNGYYYAESYMYWLKNGYLFPDAQYTPKVFIKFSHSEAILRITQVSETDFAKYTLVAKNGKVSKKLDIDFDKLNSHDVRIEVVDLQKGLVKCIAGAFPKTAIQWYFKPYRSVGRTSIFASPVNESYSVEIGLQITSYINVNSTISGELLCLAYNGDYGFKTVIGTIDDFEFVISRKVEGNMVTLDKDTDDSIRIDVDLGKVLELVCVASAYNYRNNINWFYIDKHTKHSDHVLINSYLFNGIYLYFNIFKIVDVQKSAGYYRCEGTTKENQKHSRTIEVIVGDVHFSPIINSTNMNNDHKIPLHNRFELYCNTTGYPTPNILWLKDNKIVRATNKIKFLHYNETLVFINFTEEDVGSYRCEAINSEGSDFKETNLKLISNSFEYFWVIILVLILVLVLISVFTIMKIRNENNLRRQLKQFGLANFGKGDLEKLDPGLELHEQADFLPYDQKWEIPIDSIELGRKLGSGAFGLVLQGTMKDTEGNRILVAVKKVKKLADLSALKALATELKIMVYLGKHPNIVNLIGACTKNIAKSDLLVIVEYCLFGNLQSYLLENKQNFVNQVDSKTCQINYSIRRRNQKAAPSTSRNECKPKSLAIKFSTVLFKTNSTELEVQQNDEHSTVTFCEEDNDSTQVYTEDLVAWCYQVAVGMEYLSSRKVLHGDLAARNVLLTENKIAKICDFGLSKKTYNYDIYQKKGQVPLPVKWLAPESLIDRIFSSQSDVWSFGVLLWEFFSLGSTPYPTMPVDETFYKKIIEDGYRMEKPKLAPIELYRIMLECWEEDPSMRPIFSELVERIGQILEEPVEKSGLDMDCYKLMNNQKHGDDSQQFLENKLSSLEEALCHQAGPSNI